MFKINIKEKKYDDNIIFSNLNLELTKTSDVIILKGENGSGKSTFLNILMGIDCDYTGSVEYNLKNLKNFTTEEFSIYHQNVVTCVFQDLKLFESLSVEDNLDLFSSNQESLEQIINELELNDLLKKKVEDLSGGQKQRVAIARALLMETEYLLFDEPTTGLDESKFEKFIDIINNIKNKTQIIIVTHDNRFEDQEYLTFKIFNKNIFKADNEIERENINKNNETEEPNSGDLKYFKNKLKNMKLFKLNKQYIFKQIQMSVVMALLLLIFLIIATLSLYISNSILGIVNGEVSENTIVLRSDRLKEEVDIPGYLEMGFTNNRMYWSQEDIEEVEKIKGVTAVDVASANSNFYTDTAGNRSIYSIKPHLKTLSSIHAPSKVEFVFNTMQVPKEFADDYYPYPQEEGYGLIYGTYPADNVDELMIPDLLAKQISQSDEIQSVIGKKISIPIENIITKKRSEKEYEIVGIYKTKYKKYLFSEYALYIGYRDSPVADKSDEFYNNRMEAYNMLNKEGKEYYSEVMSNRENFNKVIGLGMNSLIIEVDDEADQEEIIDQLEVLFPEYDIMSRHTYKTGDNRNIYLSLIFMMIGSLFLISIIFGCIVTLFFRNYYYIRIKELSIIQVLGYSLNSVKVLLFLELVMMYLLSGVILLIIALLFNTLMLFNIKLILIYIIINILVVYKMTIKKLAYKKIRNNIK